jgi:hypothetical protein
MSNLFFPQLLSGALAQYPIEKTYSFRSVTNNMQDGRQLLFQDRGAARIRWTLSYVDLEQSELEQLRSLYNACSGNTLPFTFIDPTANLLRSSEHLDGPEWQAGAGLTIKAGCSDPRGGSNGCLLANNSQTDVTFMQTLALPSHYQYCLSLFARSESQTNIQLLRRGSQTSSMTAANVTPSWHRLVSAGSLQDYGTTLCVGLTLGAGQAVQLFGLQLEAQPSPSEYRASSGNGGVHANAYWGSSSFAVMATAPGLFATEFVIETSLA